MAYSPTIYVNGSTPAVSAENLNKSEQGIANNDKRASVLENATKDSSLLQFVRGAIMSGVVSPANNYVHTDYYYATKGSTITISPFDFGLGALAVYFYTEPDETKYTDGEGISATSAGDTTVYTFTRNAYFRVRAAKAGNPDLTDAEVAKFNLFFTFDNYISSAELKRNIVEESEKIINKVFENDLLQFVRGTIIGGVVFPSNSRVHTDFYYTTKGSTLTISPVDFGMSGMAVYFYTEADESGYDSAESITNTAAGNTLVYTFPKNAYFRLRAAKDGTDLSDAEVAKFSLYFTLNSLESNKEFVNISKELCSIPVDEINSMSLKNYFPSAWKTRLEELHFDIGNCFAFGVQADTHLSTVEKTAYGNTYPAMTKEDATPFKMFTNYVGLDFITVLGDIIRGREFDTYSEAEESYTEIINRYIEGVACPVLFTVGNHDDDCMWTVNGSDFGGNRSLDELILPSEQYGILMKPSKNTCVGITNPPKELYYYKDFDDVRVIVLNSRDLAYEGFSIADVDINHHEISATQRQWLETVALDTDKPVIIMLHVALVSDLRDSGGTFDGATETYNIIKNFKTNGGTVVGVFCGHIHEQRSATIDGILNVSFANGARFAEIVIVDTDNKTVKTKMVGNYGSKTDRSFTYS